MARSSRLLLRSISHWVGNTPKREMMKLMVRKGTMLSCGWLPPMALAALGFMVAFVLAPGAEATTVPAAQTPPAGLGLEAPAELAWAEWVCPGIWLTVRGTLSAPAISPR